MGCLFCWWCVGYKWDFEVVFYFVREWGLGCCVMLLLFVCPFFAVGRGGCPASVQCFSDIYCDYLCFGRDLHYVGYTFEFVEHYCDTIVVPDRFACGR